MGSLFSFQVCGSAVMCSIFTRILQKTKGFAGYFKGSSIQGTWESISVSSNYSIAYLEYVPVLLSILAYVL